MKAKKLPSGNWRVNAYIGTDSNGKQIRKSFTAPTKKQAEFLAVQYLNNQKHGNDYSGITLADAFDRYITSKENVLSPSTIRGYRQIEQKHLQELMRYKLSQLTEEKIQLAINNLALSHSPKTVRNIHGLLVAVLKTYAPSYHFNITLPQKEKPMIFVPNEQQISRLLSEVKNTELEKAILLGAVGGLRRSEISALTAADVSENGIIVNKAVVCNSNGDWVLKTTKTTESTRFVTLPKEVVEKLKPQDGTNKIVNLQPNIITNRFRNITRKLFGQPIRFHSLRHFSASFLHSLNVPTAYIMKRGGWSNPSTLQKIYTHTMEQQEKEFNDFINASFEQAFSEK